MSLTVTEFKKQVAKLSDSDISRVYVRHKGEIYNMNFLEQNKTDQVWFTTERRIGERRDD